MKESIDIIIDNSFKEKLISEGNLHLGQIIKLKSKITIFKEKEHFKISYENNKQNKRTWFFCL